MDERVKFAIYTQNRRWIYVDDNLWIKAVPDGVESITAMKKSTNELLELFEEYINK